MARGTVARIEGGLEARGRAGMCCDRRVGGYYICRERKQRVEVLSKQKIIYRFGA